MNYIIGKTNLKKKAFTMIEVLMALSVMIIVVLAVTSLTIQNIRVNQRNIHNLQAQYLNIEAIEAFRSVRDSNNLNNYFWLGKDGAFFGASFEDLEESGEYFTIRASDQVDEINGPWQINKVNIEEDDLSLDDGIFDRYLYIMPVSYDEDGYIEKIYLETHVTWDERGKEQDLSLFTYLTNWN